MGMAVPFGPVAGESNSDALRLDFDGRIKLQFHGAKLSSDGGLLLFRELDAALGLTEMANWELRERRRFAKMPLPLQRTRRITASTPDLGSKAGANPPDACQMALSLRSSHLWTTIWGMSDECGPGRVRRSHRCKGRPVR